MYQHGWFLDKVIYSVAHFGVATAFVQFNRKAWFLASRLSDLIIFGEKEDETLRKKDETLRKEEIERIIKEEIERIIKEEIERLRISASPSE